MKKNKCPGGGFVVFREGEFYKHIEDAAAYYVSDEYEKSDTIFRVGNKVEVAVVVKDTHNLRNSVL